MAEAGGEAVIGKGLLRARDGLCNVKPPKLGLGSGVVAADGAIIARRRRATGGGAYTVLSGAKLSKPLTYYA